MNNKRTSGWLIWLSAAALATLSPQSVAGSCSTTYTLSFGFSNDVFVGKRIAGSPTCSVARSDAMICTVSTVYLVATTNLATGTYQPSPVCEFNCDCGTVTIDSSDGLPVELLEFEVVSTEKADQS